MHCPFQIPFPNNKSHSLPFAPFTSRSFVTVPRFHKALIFTFWWLPHLQLWLAVPFHKLFWVLHLSSWDIRVSTLTKTASLLFLISHEIFVDDIIWIIFWNHARIAYEWVCRLKWPLHISLQYSFEIYFEVFYNARRSSKFY